MLAGTLPVTHFFAEERPPPDLVHVCGGGEVAAGEGPERLAPEGPRAPAAVGNHVPVVRSDAGDEGAAAIHQGKVIYRQWAPHERGFSSDVREILIVQDAARAMGPQWRGKRVVSGNCDCMQQQDVRQGARGGRLAVPPRRAARVCLCGPVGTTGEQCGC